VLAAGYADGYPHRLVNKGKVIIHGHLAPIVGSVSMDLLTVDVTDCPPVIPGDSAILLGRAEGVSMDAQDIARLAETIPYAILCGIGRRVKRVYVAGGAGLGHVPRRKAKLLGRYEFLRF
jgi:alanine racemase